MLLLLTIDLHVESESVGATSPWHIGIHLIVFGKSFPMNTNMTEFKVIVKYFCDIVP